MKDPLISKSECNPYSTLSNVKNEQKSIYNKNNKIIKTDSITSLLSINSTSGKNIRTTPSNTIIAESPYRLVLIKIINF